MEFKITVAIVGFVAATTSCDFALAEKAPMWQITPSLGNMEGKSLLAIPALVNYGGNILPMGPLCIEGIQMAVDASARRLNVSRRYQIVIDVYDEGCKPVNEVATAIGVLESSLKNESNNLVPLMIGPVCSGNSLTGMVLSHYNFLGVADLSPSIEVYKYRQRYKSFFPLLPSPETSSAAIPSFLESNGWTRVFLLTETTSYWNSMEEGLQMHLASRNITLAGTSKVIVPADPERFEMAVGELAAMQPRVVLVNSNYAAWIPCYLYRFKLYGPAYVYIYNAASFFLPNTVYRLPNCTDEMIFEVLRSVIFFYYGSPININGETVDALGTSKAYFENRLKERVRQAHLSDMWFFWRGTCYNEVAASLALLDQIESSLQNENDSLLNWVTRSEKFRQNGSYIASLMRTALERFTFNGLTTNGNEKTSNRKGLVAFYQVQLSVSEEEVSHISRENLSAAIKVVAVATHGLSLQRGPGKAFWRTRNGEAPFDSLRILPIKDPILTETSKIVLTVIVSLLLFSNAITLLAVFMQRHTSLISNSVPSLNGLLLFGNMLILAGVLVLPAEGSETSHVSCMSASLLGVIGFTLIVLAVMAKKEIGLNVASTLARLPRHSTMPRSEFFVRRKTVVLRSATYAIRLVLMWTILPLVLMVIWFAVEPIETVPFQRTSEPSENDLYFVRQHYILSCSVGRPESFVSSGFVASLIVSYAVAVLRSYYVSFALRSVTLREINDLHLLRAASYGTALLVFCGIAVVWSFYMNSDPSTLQLAISTVAILVVSLNISVIFIPKLKRSLASMYNRVGVVSHLAGMTRNLMRVLG